LPGTVAVSDAQQKFTALSPSSLLAVGTTGNKVSLLFFPSLEQAVPNISLDAELVDLDWGGVDGEWVSTNCVSMVLTC
jgi:prolactin regulatory element-binding protein